jgi:hypothetical protein
MAKTNAATQDFVAIKDVKGGVVVQTNGKLVSILLASSVNFALKSLDEQQAILLQFQNFLNTLDFSLQIYVQSRRLNIEPYLAKLSDLQTKQDNDLMRIQLSEYMEFIRTFTSDVDIMSKNFFVVVPYAPTAVSLKKGMASILSAAPKNNFGADARFEEQRLQLEQRVSLVSEGLARLGVKSIQLQQDELVELFYHIYNPSDPTGSAPVMEKQ